MQDAKYDMLNEMLSAHQGDGLEEKLKGLLNDPTHLDNPDWAKQEEFFRKEMEPKYVIVKKGFGRYGFRAGYVEMHRDLLSENEIRHRECDGGGFWGVDGEKNRVTLYDSSSDFGRPKHIEDAIRQDGFHLLDILGRVCDKSGEQHDLSGYDITYIDAIGHRHKVEPISHPSERTEEMKDVNERLRDLAASSSQALVNAGHKHSYANQKPKDYAKKKKAKRRQQKQAHRHNK